MSHMSNWARHVRGPLVTHNVNVPSLSRGFSTKTKVSSKPKTSSKSTRSKFKSTNAMYLSSNKENATNFLMSSDSQFKIQNDFIMDTLGNDLLYVKDPVLREEIVSRERAAAKQDTLDMKKYHSIIQNNSLNSISKIHELIDRKAPTDVVLNAMYNVMPRTAPIKSHASNIDYLSWRDNIKPRRIDEVDLNGYDLEDSEDPDNLPRQRKFTVDEMNRILQDVEESRFVESEFEDTLFIHAGIAEDMYSVSKVLEVEERFRVVAAAAGPKTRLDDMTIQDVYNFKLDFPQDIKDKEKELFGDRDDNTIDTFEITKTRYDRNHLANYLVKDAREWTSNRAYHLGKPQDISCTSGAIALEDYVARNMHSNAGVGLIPEKLDFATLPLEKMTDDLLTYDHIHDPFDEISHPVIPRVEQALREYLSNLNKHAPDAIKDASNVILPPSVQQAIDDNNPLVENIPTQLANAAVSVADGASKSLFKHTGPADPELLDALVKFFDGTFSTIIEAGMNCTDHKEQIAIVKPFIEAYHLVNREKKLTTLKRNEHLDEEGNVVVDDSIKINYQDGMNKPVEKQHYDSIMGLFDEDPEVPEMAKLRNKLSRDELDDEVLMEDGSVDPYFVEVTDENSIMISPEDIHNVVDHITKADPFRSYYEPLESSKAERVEYMVPFLADVFDNSGKDHIGKVLKGNATRHFTKTNNIEFNHIISKKDIKRLGRGLSLYSGLPQHLLDFLKVFHNNRDMDYVAANRAEATLRERIQLERLAQPSTDISNIDRPDDSADEAPSISTPITFNGPNNHNGINRIREVYNKHIETSPIAKRIEKYKVALMTPLSQSIDQGLLSSSDEEWYNHDTHVPNDLYSYESMFTSIRDQVLMEKALTPPEEFKNSADLSLTRETPILNGLIDQQIISRINKRLQNLPREDIVHFFETGELPGGVSIYNEDVLRSIYEGIDIKEEVINEYNLTRINELSYDEDVSKLTRDEQEQKLLDMYLENKAADSDNEIELDLLALKDLPPPDSTEQLILATLKRERQILREVTKRLNIRNRSDHAAIRRIFSIDPIHARNLVNKAVALSNGNRFETNPRSAILPAAWINWQKEVADLEYAMITNTTYMNTRSGGVFPGVPGGPGRDDPTVFKIPELLSGEFAPLFVDQNLEHTDDPDPEYLLPGHANSPFLCTDKADLKITYIESQETISPLSSVIPITADDVMYLKGTYDRVHGQERLEDASEYLKVRTELEDAYDHLAASKVLQKHFLDRLRSNDSSSEDSMSGEESDVPLFNPESDGTFDPTRHGAYHPSKHGQFDPAIHGQYNPTIHGKFNSSIHGKFHPAIHGAYDEKIHCDVSSYDGAEYVQVFEKEDGLPATYFPKEQLEVHQEEYLEDDVSDLSSDAEFELYYKLNKPVHEKKHPVYEAEFNRLKDIRRKEQERIHTISQELMDTEFDIDNTISRFDADRIYQSYENVQKSDSYLRTADGEKLTNNFGTWIKLSDVSSLGDLANATPEGKFLSGISRYNELEKLHGADAFEDVCTTIDGLTMYGRYNPTHGFIPLVYKVQFTADKLQEKRKDASYETSYNHVTTRHDHFDPVTIGPSGYPTPLPTGKYIKHIATIAKNSQVKVDEVFQLDVHTSDPEYNFYHLMTDRELIPGRSKFHKREEAKHLDINLNSSQSEAGSDWHSDYENPRFHIDNLYRPDDHDIIRGLVDPTTILNDHMTVKQKQMMKYIYELRNAKNFFDGRLAPGEYAFMRNNFRLMDKARDLDTFTDQENDLAHFQKEMVVGVVREWINDHDNNNYREEFDCHNVEPDYDPLYNHEDVVNAFAAHRFSPYSNMPISESNIPPLIGKEMQKHVHMLHLLDPVTFHPRWIARRLNLPYLTAVSMMKIQDMHYKRQVEDNGVDPDELSVESSDAESAQLLDEHMFASTIDSDVTWKSDILTPHPVETTLDYQDPEHLFARFAPTLIGRVSWTKHPEKFLYDRSWYGFNFRPNSEMFGDDPMFNLWHYEQKMNKRWASREKLMDAMEKAAFARFGPLTWGGRTLAQLHNPVKLPREVISTTLHPPGRNHWMLTILDEAKSNVFSICVRDRDGYLRHPTWREFQAVRFAERDRRFPFYWRKYHVLGRIPEISNLFVDQLHALKKQMVDQYYPSSIFGSGSIGGAAFEAFAELYDPNPTSTPHTKNPDAPSVEFQDIQNHLDDADLSDLDFIENAAPVFQRYPTDSDTKIRMGISSFEVDHVDAADLGDIDFDLGQDKSFTR